MRFAFRLRRGFGLPEDMVAKLNRNGRFVGQVGVLRLGEMSVRL